MTHNDSTGGEPNSTPTAPPARIEICEVGPRDGLQIESKPIATADKIRLIDGLIAAGLRKIQVGSFVSPRAVPQLADAEDVLDNIRRHERVTLTALVPNARGAERAARTRIDVMALFCSASETHNLKNLNRSIEDTTAGFPAVVDIAENASKRVQGSIATAFGCPFEGNVNPTAVVHIARAYRELGITDLNLGDTTGMATPVTIRAVLAALRDAVPDMAITLHLHNTRGIGLANVLVGLAEGITRYDAAIGGLGGCPFAAGATGNICTEDLVYMLEESGFDTGVDLEQMIAVARTTQHVIGRELPGHVMKAGPRLRRYDSGVVQSAAG